ncbi:MAG TPA: 3-hydroxyacyl-CoA dehydrogenase NAD-binding domain-containing protein [Thermoleophilaceae bacterium]|nr:3-hydroxyacyl-CoA dehydrogenase NAD-binding domain-containing protein [Thermoleophilaceae bacterium]
MAAPRRASDNGTRSEALGERHGARGLTVGRLGVVGAGTMGAGIAQLGCAAGIPTVLHDPLPEALERGAADARRGLERWAEKGRVGEDAAGLLETADALDGLAGCELVIEAAPERVELKRELFAQLSRICGPDAVLATNTSSIPVTSLASAAEAPENVVGMHFFNPPPLMRLLEVIRADQTGEAALAVAREVGEAMGKEIVLASDGPGFLVNRCGRPFSAEALRSLQERLATHEQIDRVYRLGGGFRMGPFELMDLVGIDTGFEVAKSFTELSFGEPRWRPNQIQARMVAAGRLGRKSGRGYYDYDLAAEASHRPDDPEPPAVGGGDGMAVAILGAGPVANGLRERAREAGYELREGAPAELVVDAGVRPAEHAPGGAPLLALCADRTLAARGEPGAVGFHALPPLTECRLVELTRLPTTPSFAVEAAERFFATLGFLTEWVGDAPGLILGRSVCQLVNEAAFAIGEGVGEPGDVDTGLTLGLNHPRGPVAWSRAIGLDHVVAVLDGLWETYREERYRVAPLLRRAQTLELDLDDTRLR